MDQTDQITVAIMVPSGETWKADMAMAFGAVISYTERHGVRTALSNHKGSVVSFNRDDMSEIVNQLPVDYLFWFDSDMVVPHDIIIRLLSHKEDIVGCVYPRRAPPFRTLGMPLDHVDLSKGGLVPFWLLPGGCVLISAKVYRTIPKPWYFNTVRQPGAPIEAFFRLLADHYSVPVPNDIKELIKNNDRVNKWLEYEEEMYQREFHGAKRVGEDYNFFLKAQRYGFDVYCDLDYSYKLTHIGESYINLSLPGEPDK